MRKSATSGADPGVAVGPVARPPGAQDEARDERDRPAEARVLADRAGVVVPVAEEVPVLVVRALGPRLDPAVLAREDDAGGVVEQRPAGARDEPRVEGGAAAHAVDGPPRTAEVVPVDRSRRPAEGGRLGPLDAQVAGVERPAVRCVAEDEAARVDDRRAVLLADLERRRLGPSLRERVGAAVLEVAVARPLHPQQPGGEDREAGVAGAHLRRVRGDGVARHADALEQRGGRLLSPHATGVSQTAERGARPLSPRSRRSSRSRSALPGAEGPQTGLSRPWSGQTTSIHKIGR